MVSVPETTLPRVTLAEVTFSLLPCKINQPFTLGTRTRLGGRDNSGERVVSPRPARVTRGERDNFSSYKCFGSPTRDSSQRGKCHVMPRSRILKAEIGITEVKINSAKHTVIG